MTAAVSCLLKRLLSDYRAVAMSVRSAVNRAQKKARGAPPMLPGGMMPQMFGGPTMPQMYGGMMPQQMFHPPQSQVGEGDTYTSEDEQVSSSTVPPKAAGIPLQQESSAVTAVAELQEDGVQHHQRLPDALISRSVTYVKQLPRNRVSETLEAVDGQLDASFTSELSSDGYLIVLWLYCRVKPCVKISDLRALTECHTTDINKTDIRLQLTDKQQ